MFVTILLFLCALGLSGIAAYYSIVGLATIFASAFWPVVLMAGTLEVSKLVVASWLYQKWKIIPFLIKSYFIMAVIILMGITSLGIFGFLSRAHLDQNLGNTEISFQIEQIDSKINSSKNLTDRYDSQLRQLDRAIDIQLDEKRGVLAGQERKKQEQEREFIRKKLDEENKNVQELQIKKTELKQKISIIESKVGPIKYVAEFFSEGKSVDLDKAVRWMIVLLVVVFDPLAILMIIAANIGFKHWNDERKIVKSPTKDNNISSDTMPDQSESYFTPNIDSKKNEPRFVTNFNTPNSDINVISDLTTTPIIQQAITDDNEDSIINNMDHIEAIDEHPTTGFFEKLSDSQKKMTLEYDGPENHGDPSYKLDANEVISKLQSHNNTLPKIALNRDDQT